VRQNTVPVVPVQRIRFVRSGPYAGPLVLASKIFRLIGEAAVPLIGCWEKRKISPFTVSRMTRSFPHDLSGIPLMFLIRTPFFTRPKIEMLEGQPIGRVLNEPQGCRQSPSGRTRRAGIEETDASLRSEEREVGVTENDNLSGVLVKEIQRISGEPDLCHSKVDK
jgi:hypothetical protein